MSSIVKSDTSILGAASYIEEIVGTASDRKVLIESCEPYY
ncbi:hypothetical protein BCF46_1791 [Litoreibacter meonggei]|uniref:Uncharacterized protein n=1 Tax=Litoreibacter meonggei TaxID=1049199 RepID=A0A497W8Q5_9RHOB|nr:hypothetical protein BCF46_1791 [Litoreibacter meonggei]